METGFDTSPYGNGESPFPYKNYKRVPASIRGSPYGNGAWHILEWKKGESLFCGWKKLAKKFEHVLRLCTWISYFLVKKFDFLAKNTDFPVEKSDFLVKKNDFLDDFTVGLHVSHTR